MKEEQEHHSVIRLSLTMMIVAMMLVLLALHLLTQRTCHLNIMNLDGPHREILKPCFLDVP